MQSDIYILGIGHNTAITIELAEACGYRVAGLYHYKEGRTGEMVCGVPVLGSHNDLLMSPSLQGINFALSMGDNQIREDLFCKIKKKGGRIPALVHPTCSVSRFSTIGEGVQIEAYCTVHANSHIGLNCNLQPYVLICHDVSLGAHSFIAAKCAIGAYITVENSVFMGMGAVLISSKIKKVGHHSIVGAGAVVTKDVIPFNVVAGVPARKIK